jgi:hypothetical protein
MHLPISLSDLSATEKEINIEPTDKNLQFHRHTILTKINLSIGSSSTQSTITFSIHPHYGPLTHAAVRSVLLYAGLWTTHAAGRERRPVMVI